MPAASTFQLLPPLLVKNIINHVIGSPSGVGKNLKKRQVDYDKLRPFLSTSRAWRDMALSLMLANCEIALGDQISILLPIGNLDTSSIRHISPYHTKYIKHASVAVEFEQTTNGIAIECVEHYRAENSSLVCVHSLDLTIHFDNRSSSITETKHNVDGFLIALARILPRIEETRVEIRSPTYTGNYVHREGFQTLFQKLFELPQEHDVRAGQRLPIPYMDSHLVIQNLSHMQCNWDANYVSLAQLLHKNRSSLLSLEICYKTLEGLELLFTDECNTEITYQYLSTLVLSQDDDASTTTLPKYEGIAPFPRLEILRMYIRYPFSDDLVFRGNRKTLRELYILADSMIMHVLCNAGVFLKHRLESLKQLSIADSIVQIGNIDYATEVYLKIISNALPYIDTLFLADTDIAEALPRYLENKTLGSDIRILDMPDSYMQLPCVLSLLKSLPTLQRLRCMISGLGSGLGFTSAAQVESYMMERFNSMSTHLKRWDITNDDHFPENVVIASILLTAVLNPQLEAIVFSRQKENMVTNAFEKMLGSRLFSNYKERLIPVLVRDGVMPMIHMKRNALVA
ncbi:hypothetical protein H4R20_001478 [Coemansia guatemalensis]|uniref:Uncharacterized protein n=1 Tax=Coemansia guatemalensis TaxID=2761395 RepID=A0A9W8LVL5_9FUNG|nr:hypothetical protein H4R20_001478 [Coemansia guatemalensis]